MQGNLFAAAVRQQPQKAAQRPTGAPEASRLPQQPESIQPHQTDSAAPQAALMPPELPPEPPKLPVFTPPAIKAGAGACLECGRPYAEAWWSVDRVVNENRAWLRPPRPGEQASDVVAELKRRHQALLLQLGAVECPRHCGVALVPPGWRRSQALEVEDTAFAEEEDDGDAPDSDEEAAVE